MSAVTADEVGISPSLRFAASESRVVGFGGSWMNTIRANAPRIVGMLKLAGDITVGFSGAPLLMAYSALAITGRLIMIGYGTKKNQQKTAQDTTPELDALAEDRSFTGTLKKAAHPKAYPVEASSALSVIAETFGVAYGASIDAWTPILLGLVAVGSYANMLFGKEKETPATYQETSLRFASSQSESQGWAGGIMQKFKDNPVFTSSLINSAISVGMIIGTLLEPQMSIAYLVAGAIFLAANLLQAFFVSKQEFNIEGADVEKRPYGPWDSHAAQEAGRRQNPTERARS